MRLHQVVGSGRIQDGVQELDEGFRRIGIRRDELGGPGIDVFDVVLVGIRPWQVQDLAHNGLLIGQDLLHTGTEQGVLDGVPVEDRATLDGVGSQRVRLPRGRVPVVKESGESSSKSEYRLDELQQVQFAFVRTYGPVPSGTTRPP